MKKKIVVTLCTLLLVLCLISGLAACGEAEKGDSYSSGEYTGENAESTEGESIAVTEDRLIVYTVEENISVKDITATVAKLTAKATELGGWEESSYLNENGYATIRFRIPTVKLETFLKSLEGEGTVNNKRVYTEDITAQYTDAVAKKEVYESQLAAYKKLLEEDDLTLSEVMTITDKINQIQAQIEAMSKRITGYKNQAEYSTVAITVYQLGTYVEPDYWTELGQLLQDSGSSVFVFLGGVLKVLVAILPYLGLIAVCFGLYVLIKFIICKIAKKPFGLFVAARARHKARKERKQK